VAKTTVYPDALMTPQELADYCQVPVTSVYQWNTDGTGPRRCHVGKHVRYRRRDVDTWLDKRSTEGGAA
jgi:excisionase family DNA binding protein